jgi:ATP/maltotriose-dependent transcriptional regulator MalT
MLWKSWRAVDKPVVVADSNLAVALLQAGRWDEARAAFEEILRTEPSPEALDGLASALEWLGDIRGSIAHYQRAYRAYRERGDSSGAAWTALSLCVSYKCFLGNEAAASGWLGRAETAANEVDPTTIQGWLWSLRGYLAIDHDLHLARDLMERAITYAVASGDPDLELIARGDLGIVRIKSGEVDEGLNLIDEAMAGVSAGEHTRHDTLVFVCCIMLTACGLVSDFERASQWSRVAEDFLDAHSCPFLYAECRAIHGNILIAKGRWLEAEQQLQSAIELTDGAYPVVHTPAVAYLADLKLRRGLIEEAESLLAGIEQELAAALPLAAIKLVRGQPSLAQALLERALRSDPEDSIVSTRALEMLVDVHLLIGDRQAASTVLSRLQSLACQKTWLEASARASMAAGRFALAEHEEMAALGHFEQAMDRFSRLGLPWESARARLAGAEAMKAQNTQLATVEAQGALAAFEGLGATVDAAAAAALLRTLGIRTRPGPKGVGLLTEREREVLRLLGRGLSNPEIADRLVISRKTAAHHVSSVLAKLDLRNRSEAATYALRAQEAL